MKNYSYSTLLNKFTITLSKPNSPKLENIKKYRLKLGNLKLYNILIFDLPAGKKGTCRQTCDKCYALKAEKLYKNVRKWRQENYILTKYYKDELKNMIVEQLNIMDKIKTIRIHSSGDFYSQKYLDFWFDIIKQFPDRNFYCYTKNFEILDWSNKPSNFNVINSYITINGKKYINYGTREYIKMLKEMDNTIYICPATDKSKKEKIKCGLHCNYCVKNNMVVFYQH